MKEWEEVEGAAPKPKDYRNTAMSMAVIAMAISAVNVYTSVKLGFGPIFVLLFSLAAMFLTIALYSYYLSKKA